MKPMLNCLKTHKHGRKLKTIEDKLHDIDCRLAYIEGMLIGTMNRDNLFLSELHKSIREIKDVHNKLIKDQEIK